MIMFSESHTSLCVLPSCSSPHQYPVKGGRDSSALNVAEHRQPGVVAESLYHQLQQTHKNRHTSHLQNVNDNNNNASLL